MLRSRFLSAIPERGQSSDNGVLAKSTISKAQDNKREESQSFVGIVGIHRSRGNKTHLLKWNLQENRYREVGLAWYRPKYAVLILSQFMDSHTYVFTAASLARFKPSIVWLSIEKSDVQSWRRPIIKIFSLRLLFFILFYFICQLILRLCIFHSLSCLRF